MAGRTRSIKTRQAESYRHAESESPMRPEVGTQAQFKKKLPPKTYRYDSSLSPALDWDGQNPAREQGEAELAALDAQLANIRGQIPNLKTQTPEAGLIEQPLARAQNAVRKLKALSKPFLNWAGKAERLSFDVPTLPLFIHDRLSTKAILETLKGHKRDKQIDMFSLFGDPQHSITDQVLRAYEHRDKWVNRMMLGDSLVVMNSLLHYEGLGGQVQMIYMDPPYGVKFGSNFQPFVRKRDVSHNDDEDMTREPEMVQAYRDTWELGLHSYLTYMRDRLLLARELLAPSGSIFVQISDENLHHVREVMDEVFGVGNLCSVIQFKKTAYQETELLANVCDFLLWYAKDRSIAKCRQLYRQRPAEMIEGGFTWLELPDGSIAKAPETLSDDPIGSSRFQSSNLTSQGSSAGGSIPYKYDGVVFDLGENKHWKTHREGLDRLAKCGRLFPVSRTLTFKRYVSDFPFAPFNNMWEDTVRSTFAAKKLYVVETNPRVVQRCILMTTDPGDLVLDPTCGSGTTAYVAEQWGRRWITMDTSRVPLALARQRLLTATFPWYELNDNARGPAGGFVYTRKQNNKGEEVGGIVPHVTLKSIANNEPPQEEVLVDRPERDSKITRVTGAFCVEATIPTPMPADAGDDKSQIADSKEAETSYLDRMLEILRKSPVLRLEGNKTITLRNVRLPAKTLSLSTEALVEATALGNGATLADAVQEAEEKSGGVLPLSQKPVAIVFGPENGAVSEGLVYEAAKEARAKNYARLYVAGFAIQPNARLLVEKCAEVVGIPAAYIQATPDLMMGDLLKNMRSSQIFSVCGLPEIRIRRVGEESVAASRKPAAGAGSQIANPRFENADAGAGSQISDSGFEDGQYQVELLGLDVFDPVTMENHHEKGENVPAWFLDTDYNGLCFHVSQAFFPRTGAWESLKKALKGEYEESVWEHLAGTTSAPFEAGEHKQIAVKVIDDRGNELMVVEKLS